MARYLADRGFDVWILELRGHGNSRRPEGRIEDRDGWGFDEYALKDAPAAIHYVQTVTGAPQVNWIGHSMGGMIAYAYLGTTQDPAVRSVVTLGSPGSLQFANRMVTLGVTNLKNVRMFPRISTRLFSKTWGRISGRIPFGLEEVGWHIENMSADAARLMFWLGFENIERGVARSFEALYLEGKLVSRDRKTDYQARLPKFKAPLLAIAGRNDGLAPPHTVLQVFNRVGSTDKTYELMSRTNGYSEDFGHADLMVGDRARFDVYPLIYRWLDAHQPGAGAVAFQPRPASEILPSSRNAKAGAPTSRP